MGDPSNTVAVSDSVGNSYTAQIAKDNTVGVYAAIFTTTVANPTALSSGSITVTVSGTSAAASTIAFRFREFSGAQNDAPIDKSKSGSATSGTSATTGASATPTNALCMAVGVIVNISFASTAPTSVLITGPGDTQVDTRDDSLVASVYVKFVSSTKLLSGAAAAQTYSATVDNGLAGWSAVEALIAPLIVDTPVAGNQKTEADTPNAGALALVFPGTQATEADTANVGTVAAVVAGTLASETDTANAGAILFTAPGVQAAETDTANAGSFDVAIVGTQAIETDTANIGLLAGWPGIQATETDLANVGTPAVITAGIQASESDTGNVGAPNLTLPGTQATETDTPNAGSFIIAALGTQALETDTANAGAQSGAYISPGTQALETDTPNAGALNITIIGTGEPLTDENGDLILDGNGQPITLDQAVREYDTANTHGPFLITSTGSQALETDTPGTGSIPGTVQGSQATESDIARTNGALNVTFTGTKASETDLPVAGVTPVTSAGTQATETDLPRAGAQFGAYILPGVQSIETDTPRPGNPFISGGGSQVFVSGVRANELDTLLAGTPAIVIFGNRAFEVDNPRAGTTTGGTALLSPHNATVAVRARPTANVAVRAHPTATVTTRRGGT